VLGVDCEANDHDGAPDLAELAVVDPMRYARLLDLVLDLLGTPDDSDAP
jgi:hypothetical protein